MPPRSRLLCAVQLKSAAHWRFRPTCRRCYRFPSRYCDWPARWTQGTVFASPGVLRIGTETHFKRSRSKSGFFRRLTMYPQPSPALSGYASAGGGSPISCSTARNLALFQKTLNLGSTARKTRQGQRSRTAVSSHVNDRSCWPRPA